VFRKLYIKLHIPSMIQESTAKSTLVLPGGAISCLNSHSPAERKIPTTSTMQTVPPFRHYTGNFMSLQNYGNGQSVDDLSGFRREGSIWATVNPLNRFHFPSAEAGYWGEKQPGHSSNISIRRFKARFVSKSVRYLRSKQSHWHTHALFHFCHVRHSP
jgi:hypothetical protein